MSIASGTIWLEKENQVKHFIASGTALYVIVHADLHGTG